MKVLRSGWQSSVQDLGRFGYRKFGVALVGALDPAAIRLCQLLVGNEETAAGIEIGGGSFFCRLKEDRLFAWHGGDFRVQVGGEEIPARRCVKIAAEETIEMRMTRPSRTWAAFSGGINVPVILGSRSSDVRSGIGGRLLRDGDELPLGPETERAQNFRAQISGRVSDWSAPLFGLRKDRLRVLPGKNWNEKTGDDFQRALFQVSLQSDRMGLRLEGAKIGGGERAEQVSAPVAPGTVQLPPSGLPLLLLSDCQTIGGYPKIAHVVTVDLADAAQLQPQDQVRFVAVSLAEARGWLRKRERDIAFFAAGLRARFGG